MSDTNEIIEAECSVKADGLALDDIVTGYYYWSGHEQALQETIRTHQLSKFPRPRVVSSISKDALWCRPIKDDASLGPPQLLMLLPADPKIWLVVKRKSTVANATSYYPHKCPFCGVAAYVGIFRIEHPDGQPCPRQQ